jgi:hypothetical protein
MAAAPVPDGTEAADGGHQDGDATEVASADRLIHDDRNDYLVG